VPKLADFGVARILDKSNITMETFAGTRAYMAPELFGPSRSYKADVDVYSLALVMYEFLTEQSAASFNSRNAAVDRSILYSFPDRFNPKLEDLLRRGTDRDPEVRPLLEEFEKVLKEVLWDAT
jgi:serine/threonine protein kinase